MKTTAGKFTTSSTAVFFRIALILVSPLLANCVPIGESGSPAKCYYLASGTTVIGADYRRDYDLSKKQCSESCKADSCCMAFEWRKELNSCTLKSRSLNGTVSTVEGDVFFGLCLDYDNERDRFWDHELSGLSPAATTKAHRDECEDYCKNLASGEPSSSEEKSADDDGTMKESNHQQRRHRKRSSGKSAIVIYNWQNIDPLNMDSKMGKCECITVLHSIRLSYGSFSGFII